MRVLNLNKFHKRILAVIMGFVPLGQLLYFLLWHVFGLDHSSVRYTVFISSVTFIPGFLLFLSRHDRPKIEKIDLWVLTFILITIVSYSFRADHVRLREVVIYFLFVVSPYVSTRMLPLDLLGAFFLGLLAVCGASVLYSLIFLIEFIDDIDIILRPRLLDVDHGVHLIGFGLATLIAFITGYAGWRVPLWGYIWLIGVASLCAWLLILFSSRGMAAAAFLTVIMSLFVFPKRDVTMRLIQLIFMSTAAYLAANASPPTLMFLGNLLSYSDFPGSDINGLVVDLEGICFELSNLVNSAEIRAALYSAAVSIFFENIIFGVGILNFENHYCASTFPHSTLLQTAAELGVIGLSVCGILVYLLISRFVVGFKGEGFESKRNGLTIAALLMLSLISDQLYGSLAMMPSSMALLGVLVVWLGGISGGVSVSNWDIGK